MSDQVIFQIHDRKVTALQAAQKFAENFQAHPREVERFTGADTFRLVHGHKTYRVSLAAQGWNILEVDSQSTP